MELEGNARLVSRFTSNIRNLTRIAELLDAFVDMAESGAWREYTFATGHFRWRAAEFDYFLIANDVRRDDVARVLAYNRRSKELVPLMDKNADRRKRRPFDQAAKDYRATDSLNTDLMKRAVELGWTNEGEYSNLESTSASVKPISLKSPLSGDVISRRNEREHVWRVRWSDERSPAQAVVDRLLADPEMAREVYKRLEAERVRTRRSDKRRSA